MSVPATICAWGQPARNVAQRVVLLALADHANGDGECFPRVSTLAAMCQLSDKTVRRALVALETAGAVVKVRRLHHANGGNGPWVYRLPWAVDNVLTARSHGPLGTDTARSHGPLGRDRVTARDGHSDRAKSVIEPVTKSLAARELENDTARAVDNHTAPTGTRAYAPAVLPHCQDCGRLAIACACDRGAPPPRKDLA